MERALEQSLRTVYVLSCYGSVRRLALALQGALPAHPVPGHRAETRLLRLRGLGELDLLLQLFKTTINDARLVLLPYVDARRFNAEAARHPDRVAEALREARANRRHGRLPEASWDGANPLQDADSFNDERFLAAVWRAYARRDLHGRVPPFGPSVLSRSRRGGRMLRTEGGYGEG